MTTMDDFRELRGDGTVIISIKKEHIDKVFEAIGDDLPDEMTDWMGGFVLLWKDVYLDISTWYLDVVDLLESIEEEFDDEHFSIEVAIWGFDGIEYTVHGDFGGFEPIHKYNMYGDEVDPEQFAKKE